MNLSKFDKSHKEWLDMHVSRRKGEAKRKLKTGHAHAEKEFLRQIWWPTFGHFKQLHPEYELLDFFETMATAFSTNDWASIR